MLDKERLRNYVGAPAVGDDEFLTACLTEATSLVDAYDPKKVVPTDVYENAVIQVASELFHRRNAPSGIANFSSLDGAPVRVSKDPLNSVYSLLNRFVVSGV